MRADPALPDGGITYRRGTAIEPGTGLDMRSTAAGCICGRPDRIWRRRDRASPLRYRSRSRSDGADRRRATPQRTARPAVDDGQAGRGIAGLETVLASIVEDATALLGADSGDMLLWDRERDTLRVVAVADMPSDMIGFELQFGEGLSSQAILAQHPVEVAEYGAYENGQPASRGTTSAPSSAPRSSFAATRSGRSTFIPAGPALHSCRARRTFSPPSPATPRRRSSTPGGTRTRSGSVVSSPTRTASSAGP